MDGEKLRPEPGFCQRAEEFYHAVASEAQPVATMAGKPCSWERATEHAAEVLLNARMPLFFGFGQLSSLANRHLFHTAELLRATIDPASCQAHTAATLAFQHCGQSSWSLGEMKQRADLMIFWRVNPTETHPRFLDRFTPQQHPCRRVWVGNHTAVPPLTTATDTTLTLPETDDTTLLKQLRFQLAGWSLPQLPQALQHLAEAMQTCTHGVIIFGDKLTASRHGQRACMELLRLVAELNTARRFYALHLPTQGGNSGAEAMLTWQTGYAHAVNINRASPRSQAGLYTAAEMLQRGEVDVAVQVGPVDFTHWPQEAITQLQTIKLIQLLPAGSPSGSAHAAVRIVTAVPGIHSSGVATRLDELRLPLRQYVPTGYPEDTAVALRLLQHVQ